MSQWGQANFFVVVVVAVSLVKNEASSETLLLEPNFELIKDHTKSAFIYMRCKLIITVSNNMVTAQLPTQLVIHLVEDRQLEEEVLDEWSKGSSDQPALKCLELESKTG